jgi:hypothetical protein
MALSIEQTHIRATEWELLPFRAMSHLRALLPVCLLGATSAVCAQTDELQVYG